jgi:UDP-3-O-[3-hydroxymyristoyl] glucosamine N-acyltransferase
VRAWTLLPTLFAADAFAQADQSVVWNVVAEVDTLITETDARGWDGDEELRGDLRLWYDDADTSGSYEDSLGRAALYLVNSPHAEKIWVRVPTQPWNFLDIVDGTNPDDDTFDLTSPAWGPPIDAFELTGLGIDLIDTDGDAWATAALTGTIPDLADFETATISVTWDDGSPVTQTFTITSLTSDSCPTDPYKTAPGTCGCGFLDLDPDNAGGVDTCVSRTAVIDPSVTIGVDTTIGENVWIGPGVTLGTGVTIGATSSIGAGAELGDDVTLGTSVVIDDGAVLADDVFAATRARVGAAATVGVGALLGRRVVIGADADVAAGAVLGSDTLIGRRAQIGASVVSMYSANVGEGASIGASTLLGNLSAVGRSVTVGTNAVIGRAVSISADSTVGNNARFGANDAVGARSQVGAGLIVAANVAIGPASSVGRRRGSVGAVRSRTA